MDYFSPYRTHFAIAILAGGGVGRRAAYLPAAELP
jgi:hypothetical protein